MLFHQLFEQTFSACTYLIAGGPNPHPVMPEFVDKAVPANLKCGSGASPTI